MANQPPGDWMRGGLRVAALSFATLAAMPDHRRTIESSHGQKASFYWPVCSCGWIGGDCRSEDEARAEFEDHAAGMVPAWMMRLGQRPGWER